MYISRINILENHHRIPHAVALFFKTDVLKLIHIHKIILIRYSL